MFNIQNLLCSSKHKDSDPNEKGIFLKIIGPKEIERNGNQKCILIKWMEKSLDKHHEHFCGTWHYNLTRKSFFMLQVALTIFAINKFLGQHAWLLHIHTFRYYSCMLYKQKSNKRQTCACPRVSE